MSGRGSSSSSHDPASDAIRSLADFLGECDAALIAYLQARDEDTAARELERLHKEFIRPAARAELTRLVRRGLSRDRKELQQRTRRFSSLSIEVEGDVVLHLRRRERRSRQ